MFLDLDGSSIELKLMSSEFLYIASNLPVLVVQVTAKEQTSKVTLDSIQSYNIHVLQILM